jgi:mannose-6-phosphate isomerase-like protein (cupin superfamily)
MTQSFWLLGSHLTIVADRTTTDGKYDLIEGYSPPGMQTPPHRHTRYSEQLYVLEGEYTVWIGKNKVVLGTGESVLIPMGTPHVVAATSDQPSRGLVVASPSGFADLQPIPRKRGTVKPVYPARNETLFHRLSRKSS